MGSGSGGEWGDRGECPSALGAHPSSLQRFLNAGSLSHSDLDPGGQMNFTSRWSSTILSTLLFLYVFIFLLFLLRFSGPYTTRSMISYTCLTSGSSVQNHSITWSLLTSTHANNSSVKSLTQTPLYLDPF